MEQQQQQVEQRRRPDEGPGAELRFWGAFVMGGALPAGLIFYVFIFSPIAPARYYRRIEGVAEGGAVLAMVLGSIVGGLVVLGALLYLAGVYRARSAARAQRESLAPPV